MENPVPGACASFTASDGKLKYKQLMSLKFPFVNNKVFIFPDLLSQQTQGGTAHGSHSRNRKNAPH